MKPKQLISAVISILALISFQSSTGSTQAFSRSTAAPTAVISAPLSHAAADSLGRRVAVYAIQLGAFSVRENADKLASDLKSKGIDAVIYDNLIDGKRLLYLVWVGRFDRAEDAIVDIRKIEGLTGIRGVLREQMIWRRK